MQGAALNWDENPREIIKIGKAMLENEILPRIPHAKNEMTAVIDITSGDYEIDFLVFKAVRRLEQRRPDAVLYITPVGPPTSARAVSLRTARRPADD